MFTKKGETESNIELWFLIAALLLAAVAGISLLNETADRVRGKTLEKNFIARDLALTLDAVYAGHGDVEYLYNLGKNKYLVHVAENAVQIRESSNDKPVTYETAGFAPNVRLDVKTSGMVEEDCSDSIILRIRKRYENDGTQVIQVISLDGLHCGTPTN